MRRSRRIRAFFSPNSLRNRLIFFLTLYFRAQNPLLLDVPEMPFCLDGMCLAFQNTFLTLDICVGFFPQLFPPFVALHHFIPVRILCGVVFIKTFGFMPTAAAVCAAIYFYRLDAAVLFFSVRPQRRRMSCCNISRYLLCMRGLSVSHGPEA